MAGATGANADKEKSAWMRDDTGKRSAGGHMGYSENTSCRSVHDWDKYTRTRGVFRSHKNPQHPNFPSHQNHIETLNIANNSCMEY